MLNNYKHDEKLHNKKAATAFLPILFKHIIPKSVIDIGCGLGTWLKVLEENGIKDIIGVDGNHIDKSKLQIDEKNFILHDLNTPFSINRKFDLVINLEVAEHLSEQSADILIETLTNLSNTILFSAALPFQGGQNHINEQPFSYWIKKFNKKGFIVKDVFRNEIWNNKEIEWWYKQNIFLIKKSEEKQELINDYYHPESYFDKARIYFIDQLSINRKEALLFLKTGIAIIIKSLKKILI
ncbi:MAG TPA: methyltransferase domain-containing protein, partial [Patescibacteria group bacterium]|nr:methyltransferase domain-containing protein [Patescibacteria group bacterium]